MGDCVKGCREVQEDQNTDVARICSDEEVVSDLDEGSFCAIACPEARLKGFIESLTCAAGVGQQLLFPGFCSGKEGLRSVGSCVSRLGPVLAS